MALTDGEQQLPWKCRAPPAATYPLEAGRPPGSAAGSRFGGTQWPEPQLKDEDVVDDKARLRVGRREWQQRRDAAVLAVALEAPLPRLVEGGQCGRVVVAHGEAHARVARGAVLQAQVGGDVRALRVGAASPRVQQQRPAPAVELEWCRGDLAGAELRKSRSVHSWTGEPSRAAERSSSIALHVWRNSVVVTSARSIGSSSAFEMEDAPEEDGCSVFAVGGDAVVAAATTAVDVVALLSPLCVPAAGTLAGGGSAVPPLLLLPSSGSIEYAGGGVGGSLPTASITEQHKWCSTAPKLCARAPRRRRRRRPLRNR